MPFIHSNGWSFGLRFGHWYITVFLKPSHWAFDWHRNEPCCKYWLLLGCFEINRVWCDADEYPFSYDE